jgi:hypothetical protein
MQATSPRRVSRRVVLPFVLFLAPVAAAHAAESCESTFSMKGSVDSGYTLIARNPATGVTARDAIDMMAKAAAAEDFEVAAPTFDNGEAQLQITEPATLMKRAIPMSAVATDGGVLTLTINLPKKMGGDEATLRTYACGIVSRVKSTGFKAYTAIPSRFKPSDGTGPMPVPYSPADTNDLCMHFFRGRSDIADDTKQVYRTLTFYNGSDDARTVTSRVKQKLTDMKGMRLVGETYGARSGFLDIQVDSPEAYLDVVGDYIHEGSGGDLRAFPIRVTVDTAVDQVTIVLSPNTKQLLDRTKASLAVCSLAAAAGQVPDPVAPPPPKPQKRKIFNNPFKHHDGMETLDDAMKVERAIGAKFADALYMRSNYAGKSFVFVPMLNLRKKYEQYSWDQVQTQYMAEYWQDASSRVIWQLRGSPTVSFNTGPHTSQEELGGAGYWAAISYGKTLYALYIIEAGTYDLTGLAMDQRRAELNDISGAKWKASPALGMVTAVPTVDNGFYMNREWQPATYRTSSSPESSCALAVGGVGPCVSYTTTMVSHTEQTSDGHYADVKRKQLEPGISLSAKLAKPLASFTVGRSEVVLIDGMLGGGIHFDKSACKSGDNGVATCALASATLYEVPAEVEGLQKEVSSMQPGVASDTFSGAKVLPITVLPGLRTVADKPGSWEAGWAKQLSLGK